MLTVALCTTFFGGLSLSHERINSEPLNEETIWNAAPPNIQVNYLIEELAAKYKVPEKLVRRCAYKETSYKGIWQFSYNPYSQSNISSASARGPLQILNICARDVWGRKISSWSNRQLEDSLRYNLRFSVETGIKHMSNLYKKYRNWETVFSVYNQGWIGEKASNDYARWISK